MIRAKWLIYTVLIGLVPFFIRCIIYLVIRDAETSYILNEVDLITFGLVLHLSNINELENKSVVDGVWKTKCIGLSLFMIIIFAVFLGVSYFADFDTSNIVNKGNIRVLALCLSVVSFIFSYSIYNRLNALAND